MICMGTVKRRFAWLGEKVRTKVRTVCSAAISPAYGDNADGGRVEAGQRVCIGRVKLLFNQSIPFRVCSVFPATWGIVLFARQITRMLVSDKVLIRI